MSNDFLDKALSHIVAKSRSEEMFIRTECVDILLEDDNSSIEDLLHYAFMLGIVYMKSRRS